MGRLTLFVLFVVSAFAILANAQVAPSPDPDPWPDSTFYHQLVLDAQNAVWDHILGEESWTIDDYTVPLDGEPVMGQWGTATSNATGDPIAFYYNAVIEGDFDDPFDDGIPTNVLDWVIANGYVASFVFGRAYGPASGPVPIGFAGIAFGLPNQSGAMEWRVVVIANLDLAIVDTWEEMESMYQESLSLFGDLVGDTVPPPSGGFLVIYCNNGVDPDVEFNACVLMANTDLQCRRNKLKARIRTTIAAGVIAVPICLVFHAACIPSAAALGIVAACLHMQEKEIPIDYNRAIDCCCIALECRDQGGTGCDSNAFCNSTGCNLTNCTP